MTADRNCLSYWFPKLVAAGVPVPRTEIVRTAIDLHLLLDGKRPAGWVAFLAELNLAIARVGGSPCFLRTGQGSGKHDWKRTCHLDLAAGTLGNHVGALVDWSHTVDFFGLPHDVWCARELLPVDAVAVLPAYGDMPLVKEVRAFLRGGKVVCSHPYWPAGAVAEGFGLDRLTPGGGVVSGTPADAARLAAALHGIAITPGDYAGWSPLAERVAAAFADDGAWSVDLLGTRRGWYVTDCAEAARSYHWDGCEHAKSFGG